MSDLRIWCLVALMACIGLAACSGAERGEPAPGIDTDPGAVVEGLREGPFKLLLYSHTDGFRHASIEAGILMVQQLASANDFSVDATEDPAAFTAENLAQYEVVLFLNTTLDVLNADQEAAFEAYVRAGGGFAGIHSAADTEHDWPFYGELVGAQFLAHPVANQPGTLIIEDPEHPSMVHLSNPWNLLLEEFYSFKSNPRGEVRVLAHIDESSYLLEPNTSCDPSGPTFPQGYAAAMGDHPMTWCHDKFAGRAWYTAIGHEIYLYGLAEYQAHVLAGILTVARRLPADCAVNAAPEGQPAYIEPELEGCENQVLPF